MLDSAGLKRSKVILEKDEADRRAMVYSPREFPAQVSQAAVEFVKFQTEQENPDFKIDRVVSVTTGIAELEKLALSERVETEALERLKGLQEEAYKQGYDLGRDEGQETAYREKSEEMQMQISRLDAIVHQLETLKMDLVKQNEASLVQLTFELAKKMALTEISIKPDIILNVLSQAAGAAQAEESMTIRLSDEDVASIESNKARLGKEFEFIKKARLEGSPEIQKGGCVIVTNYGQVDSTIEMRLKKIWESLSEMLSKRLDTIEASVAQDSRSEGNSQDQAEDKTEPQDGSSSGET